MNIRPLVGLTTSVLLTAAMSSGCGPAQDPGESSSLMNERSQSLGASTPAHGFEGAGAGPMPTYEERVGMHLLNRVRLTPQGFGVDALAGRPLRYEPFMAEAGRWQGRHALEEDCFCQQDPEEPGPVRTCCALGLDQGVVQCLGPRVECDEEGATEREERWELINIGPGEILHEFYIAGEASMGQAAGLGFLGQVGAVVDRPLTAMALARVTNEDAAGEPAYYWTLISGRSARPASTLTSGIHMQLGPGTPFPEASAGEADFAVLFSEPAGPGEVQVVIEGQCEELTASEASRDPDNRYLGSTYSKRLDLSEGCRRYVFAAVDANGFGHTYPEYGSLGLQVDADGVVLENDGSCPIWTTARPDMACLPQLTECAPGDTRACYTGRDHSAGIGICELGQESCQNGWWSGLCEGEVTPELEERCDDPRDNNCNGFLNEGCPGGGAQPDPVDEDPGDDDPGEPTEPTDDGDEGGCACVTLAAQKPLAPGALLPGLLLLAGAVLFRRRMV